MTLTDNHHPALSRWEPPVVMAAREGHVHDVRPVGDRALLAEVQSSEAVLSLQEYLTKNPLPGQLEVVGAACTVLITTASHRHSVMARHALLDLPPLQPRRVTGENLVIEVVYDGEDLNFVAAHCRLSPEAVVATHTSQTWTAAFAGFAPGLAYTVGENRLLEVPRRASPRTLVPAGSVALAGIYSGVYPHSSPGGWQLIGHTNAAMWDVTREKPALVTPGMTVRYKAVRASGRTRSNISAAAPVASHTSGNGLLVTRALPLALIQDMGRPGHASIGVARSGALDRRALARANRIVGNSAEAAGLEIVDGGLSVAASGDQVLAVTGATVSLTITSTHGQRSVEPGHPFALLDQESLQLGIPTTGFRSYVAVRGGIDTPQVLGSRATDTFSKLGPAPVTAGSLVPVLPVSGAAVVGHPEPETAVPEENQLDIILGPRNDWFTDEAVKELFTATWSASNELNRVGIRLTGPVLERLTDMELPSEGTIPGVIQVPPNGQPVLFMADHPTTGGYPVIAVLAPGQLDKAAQIRPGASIRFRLATHEKETNA